MMCKFVEKHLSHDSFSDGVKLAANYLTAARMCCLFFFCFIHPYATFYITTWVVFNKLRWLLRVL